MSTAPKQPARAGSLPEPICKPAPAIGLAVGGEPAMETFSGAAAAVMGLRPRSCRWLLGDPKAEDFRFCGKPKQRGAWCAEHASLALAPAKKAS